MNKLDFDDSAVTKFFTEQGTPVLEVEDVRCNGALVKVTITVEGHTSLTTNKKYNNEVVSMQNLNTSERDVVRAVSLFLSMYYKQFNSVPLRILASSIALAGDVTIDAAEMYHWQKASSSFFDKDDSEQGELKLRNITYSAQDSYQILGEYLGYANSNFKAAEIYNLKNSITSPETQDAGDDPIWNNWLTCLKMVSKHKTNKVPLKIILNAENISR